MSMRIRVLLCCACIVAASVCGEELIPLEHFTRSDELGTMKISPDGEYLAMTSGDHGAEFLTFTKLSDPKITTGVRGARRARDR